MNFEISKISKDFHRYRQAEMDELIHEFLLSEANDNKCNVIDLTSYVPLKDIKYMIYRFKKEVEKIWRENENKNI